MRYQALTLVATATILSSSALAHPLRLPRDEADTALTARQEGFTYDQGHKSDGAEKGKHYPSALESRDETVSADDATDAAEKRDPNFLQELESDIASVMEYAPGGGGGYVRRDSEEDEEDAEKRAPSLLEDLEKYIEEKRDPSLLEDLEKYFEERDVEKRSFWDGGKIHWWRRDEPEKAEKDVVDKRDKPFWEGGGIHWW